MNMAVLVEIDDKFQFYTVNITLVWLSGCKNSFFLSIFVKIVKMTTEPTRNTYTVQKVLNATLKCLI